MFFFIFLRCNAGNFEDNCRQMFYLFVSVLPLHVLLIVSFVSEFNHMGIIGLSKLWVLEEDRLRKGRRTVYCKDENKKKKKRQ